MTESNHVAATTTRTLHGPKPRCSKCGSYLCSMVHDGARPPTAHIFVGSKAPWFTITDELPQFDGHAEAAGPIAG